MPNRLADAVSPYLRSHADNPVDWYPWGPEAFAEAARRDVPVLVSIGYSTCHWCHVMARESFSDPEIAAYMNANLVAIKVDREEHPDVDASYLAAASAFTEQLGWPLTVFTTPTGRAYYAGTYFPPVEGLGRPSFRQILDAILDAWTQRRTEVESNASRLAGAIQAQATQSKPSAIPTDEDFAAVVSELVAYEDAEFGGFGNAPKFPVATTIGFLLDRETAGDAAAGAVARRTLVAMAASDLRDPIEGGFFRYATRRDWSDPHYERMLYDNALLLDCYARVDDVETASGIAGFLLGVLRLPSGGFASAQDSESTVDGKRVEGGYYALDATGRSGQVPPALDEKVLTGWNGLAIGALASAGVRFARADWVDAAAAAAELVATPGPDGALLRARITGRESTARPTLEDYGMLAGGLLQLALATGQVRWAARARELVTDCLVWQGDAADGDAAAGRAAPAPAPALPVSPFAVPGGADPVLAAHGLAIAADPSEGAYPSGTSAMATAALALYSLTGDRRMLEAAIAAVGAVAPMALERPIAFGGALSVLSGIRSGARQLVVISDDPHAALGLIARAWRRTGAISTVVTSAQAAEWSSAGFELFDSRTATGGAPTAYLCADFVCLLPLTEAPLLAAALERA